MLNQNNVPSLRQSMINEALNYHQNMNSVVFRRQPQNIQTYENPSGKTDPTQNDILIEGTIRQRISELQSNIAKLNQTLQYTTSDRIAPLFGSGHISLRGGGGTPSSLDGGVRFSKNPLRNVSDIPAVATPLPPVPIGEGPRPPARPAIQAQAPLEDMPRRRAPSPNVVSRGRFSTGPVRGVHPPPVPRRSLSPERSSSVVRRTPVPLINPGIYSGEAFEDSPLVHSRSEAFSSRATQGSNEGDDEPIAPGITRQSGPSTKSSSKTKIAIDTSLAAIVAGYNNIVDFLDFQQKQRQLTSKDEQVVSSLLKELVQPLRSLIANASTIVSADDANTQVDYTRIYNVLSAIIEKITSSPPFLKVSAGLLTESLPIRRDIINAPNFVPEKKKNHQYLETLVERLKDEEEKMIRFHPKSDLEKQSREERLREIQSNYAMLQKAGYKTSTEILKTVDHNLKAIETASAVFKLRELETGPPPSGMIEGWSDANLSSKAAKDIEKESAEEYQRVYRQASSLEKQLEKLDKEDQRLVKYSERIESAHLKATGEMERYREKYSEYEVIPPKEEAKIEKLNERLARYDQILAENTAKRDSQTESYRAMEANLAEKNRQLESMPRPSTRAREERKRIKEELKEFEETVVSRKKLFDTARSGRQQLAREKGSILTNPAVAYHAQRVRSGVDQTAAEARRERLQAHKKKGDSSIFGDGRGKGKLYGGAYSQTQLNYIRLKSEIENLQEQARVVHEESKTAGSPDDRMMYAQLFEEITTEIEAKIEALAEIRRQYAAEIREVEMSISRGRVLTDEELEELAKSEHERTRYTMRHDNIHDPRLPRTSSSEVPEFKDYDTDEEEDTGRKGKGKTKRRGGHVHKASADPFGDNNELEPYLTKYLRPSKHRRNVPAIESSSDESSGNEDGQAQHSRPIGRGRNTKQKKKEHQDYDIISSLPVKEAAILIEKKGRGRPKKDNTNLHIKPVHTASKSQDLWFM